MVRMNEKQGISLVALIITIVVLIILTATVIITVNNGNTMEQANRAVFRSDIRTFQDDLKMKILDEQLKAGGLLEKNSVNAVWESGDEKTDISYWIKSYTNKYGNKFEVEKGEFVYLYSELTDSERIWVVELGLNAKSGSPMPDATDFVFNYNDEDNTATVSGLSDTGSVKSILFVPNNVEHNGKEYIVTTIRNSAFMGHTSLFSIELPDSVTTIEDGAFIFCSNLISIKLPNSLTTIGYSAFEECSSLVTIKLPSGVTTIKDSTFRRCSSLNTIELPSGVTTIEDSVFKGCYSLTAIELPSGVTIIGNSVFAECSSLTTIELPSGVTTIGDSVFEGCSSLTTIELPSGVTTIGYGAFVGCSNLATIELPDSVTTIGDYAFGGCSNLATIELPDSVTTIGDYAFYDTSISILTVPWNEGDVANAPWGLDSNQIRYAYSQ